MTDTIKFSFLGKISDKYPMCAGFYFKVKHFIESILRALLKDKTDIMYISYMVKKYKIDFCMDVGANTGSSGAAFRLFFRTKVASYEPVSHLYETLERRAKKYRKWQCYNLGIGATNTKKHVNVTGGHAGTSSFLGVKDYIAQHAKSVSKVIKKELIDIKTLDYCIENHANQHSCFFIKLDVQGYEMEVMKGLDKYLDRVLLVKLEMNFFGEDYEGQPTMGEVIVYMKERGFILTRMEEGWANPKNGELLYCDGYFINTNHQNFK